MCTDYVSNANRCLLRHVCLLGNVWLVLMILLRVLVLLFAGYPLYQDEQERFVCNTIQPGCANVCYDIFAPLSLFRFWLLQLASVFLPYALFTHREPYGEACLVKPIMKSEGRRLPRFTRAYTLQLLFRILLEGGFSAAHYYLFGLRVPSRFMCQQMPCTSTVDCYPSRASEKTVMLGFMLGASGICFLLSVLDLACAITRFLGQLSAPVLDNLPALLNTFRKPRQMCGEV
uniref:Gap junction protein delta 4 n=1 Tax=Electrophorus electricus TaxID=8005 RepID=A0A4W4DMC4_ELEEL